MTDRELLEAAAKAAGITDLRWFEPTESFVRGRFTDWNPLTDDGDALRLAVKLNLRVVAHPALSQTLVTPYHSRTIEDETREDWEKNADPYAATRRAIVRAAAEIGKGMP